MAECGAYFTVVHSHGVAYCTSRTKTQVARVNAYIAGVLFGNKIRLLFNDFTTFMTANMPNTKPYGSDNYSVQILTICLPFPINGLRLKFFSKNRFKLMS